MDGAKCVVTIGPTVPDQKATRVQIRIDAWVVQRGTDAAQQDGATLSLWVNIRAQGQHIMRDLWHCLILCMNPAIA